MYHIVMARLRVCGAGRYSMQCVRFVCSYPIALYQKCILCDKESLKTDTKQKVLSTGFVMCNCSNRIMFDIFVTRGELARICYIVQSIMDLCPNGKILAFRHSIVRSDHLAQNKFLLHRLNIYINTYQFRNCIRCNPPYTCSCRHSFHCYTSHHSYTDYCHIRSCL